MLLFILADGYQCCEGTLLSSTGLGRHCEDEGSMFAVHCWFPPTSFSLSNWEDLTVLTTVIALKFYNYVFVHRIKKSYYFVRLIEV